MIAKYKNAEVYTVYYTEELPNVQKRMMPFLKGCPLELETSGSLVNMRYIATFNDISSPVSDEYFITPKDYRLITNTYADILKDQKKFMVKEEEDIDR